MPVRVASLPYVTDSGPGVRARVGLLAAATDAVAEHDFRHVMSRLKGVELFTARYPGDTQTPAADARAVLGVLEPTVRLLLPGQRLDVLALAIGTTALAVGEDEIEATIRDARPGLHVVTPVGSVRAALAALGIRQVGMLTPYRKAFNFQVEQSMTHAGVEVGVLGSFDEERDSVVGTITESSIYQNVLTLAASSPIDGFVILGGQLRSLGIIKHLERELGLPVVGSGQALIWHALRSAGINDRVADHGLLFNLPS